MSLKQTDDGLLKVFSVRQTCEPFYSGGKVEVSKDEAKIACLHESNVKLIGLGSSRKITISSLLPEEQDNEDFEEIACFCLNPKNSDEIVVATQKQFLLKHWDLKDTAPVCLRSIKAHKMPILTMDYDPTGTLVATGSADRTVKVWDIVRGYCTHNFTQHIDIVQLVAFHPDPNRLQLFSAAEDNTIRMYDLTSQTCLATFRDHVSLPTHLSFSPDGNVMVSCGLDKVINFYCMQSKELIRTVPCMEELQAVVCLSEDHSSCLLEAALGENGISGNSASNTKKKNSSAALEKKKSSLSSQLKRFVVVTAGEKGVLKSYGVTMKGRDTSTFTIAPLGYFPLSSAFRDSVSNGKSKSSQGQEETESLVGVASLNYLPLAQQGQGELLAVTRDFNFTTLTVGQLEEALQKGRQASDADDTKGTMQAILKPSRLLIGSHGDILDLTRIPKPTTTQPAGIPLSASGSSKRREPRYELVVTTNSSQVRIMDDEMSCSLLEGHSDIVLAASVSPDGQWLVTSSKDKACLVWALSDRANPLRAKGLGHVDAVGAVCISQSKATYSSRAVCMFSGGGDKIVKRWPLAVHSMLAAPSSSIAKLAPSHSVHAHDKDINTVASSPNDAIVATGSQDKTIRLWNSLDLSPIATLKGHKRGVWKVVFSPVDKVLASCSGDRTLRLWSMADYSALRSFVGHTASVLCVKFVNNGSQILSGSADGLIRLWTIRTGECENTFDAHTDKVWAIETMDMDTQTGEALGAATNDGDEEGETGTVDGAQNGHTTGIGVVEESAEAADRRIRKKQSRPTQQLFFSAGSDSKIVTWVDATEQQESQRVAEMENTLALEQQLRNHLRNKDYSKALTVALAVKHSYKVLGIFQAILEDSPAEDNNKSMASSSSGSSSTAPSSSSTKGAFTRDWSLRLDQYVQALTDEEVEKIIDYAKDWNTNAKHTYTCQVLLGSMLRIVRVDRLGRMQRLRQALEGLIAYSERHYNRLDRLHQSSYMLEYVTSLVNLTPLENDESESIVVGQGASSSGGGGAGRAGGKVGGSSAGEAVDVGRSSKEFAVPVIFSVGENNGDSLDSDSDSDGDGGGGGGNSSDGGQDVVKVKSKIKENVKKLKKRKSANSNIEEEVMEDVKKTPKKKKSKQ